MLAGKEFDDVSKTKVGGAAMPELEPIPQFHGFRSISKEKNQRNCKLKFYNVLLISY